MTPFRSEHVDDFVKVIHKDTVKDLIKLGHTNVAECLHEIAETCDVYMVRDKEGRIVIVSGVTFDEQDESVFFALFSKDIKESFTAMARGSRSMVNFLEKSYPMMTMMIDMEYEAMLNWAAWLGFEAVGISTTSSAQYVEFVRCAFPIDDDSPDVSRPTKH